MKHLILMRHSKTEESSGAKPDFDRKLTNKGLEDAELIGAKLNSLNIPIEKVIYSSSKRTTMTAEVISNKLKNSNFKIEGDDRIYDASPFFMRNFIESIDNKISSILIIGHNPTLTFLIEYYSGQRIGSLPTTGFGHLEFEIDSWQETSYNNANLKEYIYPKALR